MMTFKVGDIVTCIDNMDNLSACPLRNLKLNKSYIVREALKESYTDFIKVSEMSGESIPGIYFLSRFVLANITYSPTQIGDTDDDI